MQILWNMWTRFGKLLYHCWSSVWRLHNTNPNMADTLWLKIRWLPESGKQNNELKSLSWQVLHGIAQICKFGLKDPVSRLAYKKSLCLMHNFPVHAVHPVFRHCQAKNSSHEPGETFHQHERVEGSCPGYGSRAKLSQVYPLRFCITVAECVGALLRADGKAWITYDQFNFVHTLLDGMSIAESKQVSDFCPRSKEPRKSWPERP